MTNMKHFRKCRCTSYGIPFQPRRPSDQRFTKCEAWILYGKRVPAASKVLGKVPP